MKGQRLSCPSMIRRFSVLRTRARIPNDTIFTFSRNSRIFSTTLIGGTNHLQLATLRNRRLQRSVSTSTGSETTRPSSNIGLETELTASVADGSSQEAKSTLNTLQDGTLPTLIILGGAAAVLTFVGLWNRYKDNQEKFWNVLEESTKKERQSHQLQIRISIPSTVDADDEDEDDEIDTTQQLETEGHVAAGSLIEEFEDGEWVVISQKSRDPDSDSLPTTGDDDESADAHYEPTIVFHRDSAAFLRVSDLSMDGSVWHHYPETSRAGTTKTPETAEDMADAVSKDDPRDDAIETPTPSDERGEEVDDEDKKAIEKVGHNDHPEEEVVDADNTPTRIPNFHHVSADPPPDVQFDGKERWIALTVGQQKDEMDLSQCHTPVAPAAIHALVEFSLESTYDQDMWVISNNQTSRALTQSPELDASVWQKDGIIEELPQDSALSSAVMVWAGSFQHGKYGFDLPAIRSAGIVNMSPKSLLELLVDSSRVKEYNKMSLYRNDILVLQEEDSQRHEVTEDAVIPCESKRQQEQESDDVESDDRDENVSPDDRSDMPSLNNVISKTRTNNLDGSFGGVTKIMKSESKLPAPLSRTTLQFTTLLHARELEDGSGYALVTRAVNLPESTGGENAGEEESHTSINIFSNPGGTHKLKSEILLGVTILKKIEGDDNRCMFVAVNHLRSPMIPIRIARPIGTSAAISFIGDLRSAATAAAENASNDITSKPSEPSIPAPEREATVSSEASLPDGDDARVEEKNESSARVENDDTAAICVDTDTGDTKDDHDELDSF